MMHLYYLKYASESEAMQALASYIQTGEDGSQHLGGAGIEFDVIGEITQILSVDHTDPENPIIETVVLAGWHINVISRQAVDFGAAAMTVTTPYRKFAGVA